MEKKRNKKNSKIFSCFIVLFTLSIIFFSFANFAKAEASIRGSFADDRVSDWDGDGLTDLDEANVYGTDPKNADSDGDGFSDGSEINSDYDPLKPAPGDKLPKRIEVSLKDQELVYFIGTKEVGRFKISSGLPRTPTPKGDYEVIMKRPLVNYKGVGYNFPNTKWNLMFKRGNGLNYYIHGAYWHNSFGKPKSHGCINVSYANMEGLYNWADVGTKIKIY